MNSFDNWKIKILDINGGDIPDSEYFALKGYTSISRLKLLDPEHGGDPQKYLEGFSSSYNESLLLGTTVHTNILQPDDFELSNYRNKPSGKLGYFVEKVFECRKKGMTIADSIQKGSELADYYSGKLTPTIFKKAFKKGFDYYHKLSTGYFKSNKEVIVLSEKLLNSAHACINSIKNNSTIQSLLAPNLFEPKQFFNEIALFSNIEVTFPNGKTHIIKFKGKLDSVIWDPEKNTLYLNDIKTTSKTLNYFMDHYIDGQVYTGTFSGHSYYTQLACYSILLQKYFQEILHINFGELKCNIFAVETTDQYRSEVFRINNSYIDLGINKFKELLCRLAYHEVYGFDKEFSESV